MKGAPGTGIILFLLLFMLNGSNPVFGSFRALMPGNLPDTSLVATINGEAVSMGEFLLVAGKLRPLVITEYRRNHGLEYSGNFWSKDIQGITPAETLKTRTLDTLVRIKVQQIRARDAGILRDIGYEGFLKSLEEENRRRMAEKESGKVIYGPVQYSTAVYYNYLFTNMVARLKELLAETDFGISDELMRSEYELNKDKRYRRGEYMESGLFEVRPGFAARAHPVQPLHIAGVDIRMYNFVFNDSVNAPEEEDPLPARVRSETENLQAGQSSELFAYRGALCSVLLYKRASPGYRSFNDCKNTIRIMLINSMYDRYVTKLTAGATCRINKNVYNRIIF